MEKNTWAFKFGGKLDSGKLDVKKLTPLREEEFSFDLETSWIHKLFTQLVEEQGSNVPGDLQGDLTVKVSIQRKSNSRFKNHVLVKGLISGHYLCDCVRCLEKTQEVLDQKFSCCFVDDALRSGDHFRDTLSVYYETEELDLHFFKKGIIDISEFVSERIYAELNPFPLHHEDCAGLCSCCGANLNHDACAKES
jgi:uncharacterized metal-binding protein YceD (DUF177 family)